MHPQKNNIAVSPIRSTAAQRLRRKTLSLLLGTSLGLGTMSAGADMPLDTWVSIQPQGAQNGLGGGVLGAYHGVGGRAFMESFFFDTYQRSSTDAPWEVVTMMSDGQTVENLRRIVAHPTFPDVVTAGVNFGSSQFGVVRSNDAGLTWSTIYQTPAPDFVTGIGVAPSDPDIVYLRVSNVGFIKTIDGGATWNTIASNIADNFESIFVDAFDPNILFTSDSGTLTKSADGGATFSPVTNGIDPGSDRVLRVAFDYSAPGTLYAANGNTDIVFKSTDSGDTWTSQQLIPGSPNPTVSDVAVDPTDSTHLYATAGRVTQRSVYESNDAGATWSVVPDPQNNASADRVMFAADGTVLIYSFAGVQKIEDDVLSGSNQGFNDFSFSGLRINGADPSRWYGWGVAGIVSTDPLAPAWANRRSTIGSNARSLYVNPSDTEQVYGASSGGIFSSIDGGQQWTDLSFPGNLFSISAVAGSPLDANIIFVTSGADLYVSLDAGVTWTAGTVAADDPQPNFSTTIVASNHEVSRAFVSTSADGLYATDDSGATWRQVDTPFSSQGVTDIELDPLHPTGMYVSTDSDVWYSADSGLTWAQLSEGLGFSSVFAIVPDPVVRGRVFAHALSQIFARDPRDGSWSAVSSGNAGRGGTVSIGNIITGDGATSGRLYSVLADIFVKQLDSDDDGIGDDLDNCILTSNANQLDGDGDGLGNACDADIAPAMNDCVVNVLDLGALRLAFFSTPGDPNWNAGADFNGDDVVNVTDLGIMRAAFFDRPGYSSLSDSCR